MQLRTGSGKPDTGESADLANLLPVDFLVELFDQDDLLLRCERVLLERPDWLTPDQAHTLEMLTRLLRR